MLKNIIGFGCATLCAIALFTPTAEAADFKSITHLPAVWENGWLDDGDTVETGKEQVIGTFTVRNEVITKSKNHRFKIVSPNTDRIGTHFSRVIVTNDSGFRARGTLTGQGLVKIDKKVVLEPGTHDFTITAFVKNTIPDDAEFQVQLLKTDFKVGNMPFIKKPGRFKLALQELSVQGDEVEETYGENNLAITPSRTNPDSTTIIAEKDDESDETIVFAFTLDADDSDSETRLQTAVVNVNTFGNSFNNLVDEAVLLIDGWDYTNLTVTNTSSSTATLTFDIFNDVELDPNERVTAELQLVFKPTDGNYPQGSQIQASVDITDWVVEADDEVVLTGSATGEIHTLLSEGIVFEPVDQYATTQGTTSSTGVFEITFAATALEDDFYINQAVTTADQPNQGGVYVTIEGPATTTNTFVTLTSTADEVNSGALLIQEGSTEDITVTVYTTAIVPGAYRVSLERVWYTDASTGVTDLITYEPVNVQDYQTDFILLGS